MSFELRIAGRYLLTEQRAGFISYTASVPNYGQYFGSIPITYVLPKFISFITYVSVFGVALGVAAIIISLSLLNGFEGVVQEKFFDFDGQIHIVPQTGAEIKGYEDLAGHIRQRPDVKGVMPFVSGKGMLITEGGQTGIMIRGLDGAHMDRALSIQQMIEYGSSFFLRADSLLEDDPIIIAGSGLFDRMELDRGDRVTLVSARFTGGIFSAPPTISAMVEGAFSTGTFEYDNLYVLVSLKTAQKLLGLHDGASGLVVKADSEENIDALAALLKKDLPDGLIVKTWYDLHRSLFASMKIERIATFIVLSLIIVVAAFNIICSLMMMVMEKRREIGILRSMGCTTKMIIRIFLLEGVIVGTIGMALGMFLGYGLCLVQLYTNFIRLPGDIFIIDVLPVAIRTSDLIFVVLVTVLIYICASFYPAIKASRLKPVEALRYE